MVFIKDGPNYIVQQQKILKKELSIEILSKSYKKGTSISKIAKEYGITRQAVYRIKKEYESNQEDS